MKKEIMINTTQGLHAKLAAKIVQLANRYQGNVKLIYEDQVVDAKSILSLISLAIPSGEYVTLVVEGDDAEVMIKDIEKILG